MAILPCFLLPFFVSAQPAPLFVAKKHQKNKKKPKTLQIFEPMGRILWSLVVRQRGKKITLRLQCEKLKKATKSTPRKLFRVWFMQQNLLHQLIESRCLVSSFKIQAPWPHLLTPWRPRRKVRGKCGFNGFSMSFQAPDFIEKFPVSNPDSTLDSGWYTNNEWYKGCPCWTKMEEM